MQVNYTDWRLYMKSDFTTSQLIVLIVALLALGLFVMPWLLIVSVNNLFGAGIEHTFVNYIYAIVLIALMQGAPGRGSK